MLPVTFAKRIGLPLSSRLDFGPFGELEKIADSLFSDCGTNVIRSDIREDAENFYVDAELPGFTADNIEVTCEDGVLAINAERSSQENREGENYHLTERRSGRVTRSFRLPKGVNHQVVDATLRDGILTVKLPKAEEVKPRKIEVKGS